MTSMVLDLGISSCYTVSFVILGICALRVLVYS